MAYPYWNWWSRVVFLAGVALALLCLVTIHRNPISEVQKLKWLLLVFIACRMWVR